MKTIQLTAKAQKDLLDSLLKRSPNHYGEYEAVVAEIIANVRDKGDEAVFEYTEKFDKWDILEEGPLCVILCAQGKKR